MQKLALILITMLMAGQNLFAVSTDGEDILRKAAMIVEETSRQQYAGQETDRKVSYEKVLPDPDEKNVIITFTIDELNRIHVVDVKGGYAYINLYIKSTLEGKSIKTESAIPGINYVMAIKLPASV